MIKMYQVEVLGKHPVIKHAYFGTIISFKWFVLKLKYNYVYINLTYRL